MKNVLFIHGLGGSGDTLMGEALDSLNDLKFTFHHPDFSSRPKKALQEVNEYIEKHHIDVVIGMSVGGFYALQSDCSRGVLINPTLTPRKDIEPAFGYGTFYCADGFTTFTLDSSFYDELDQIILENDPNADLDHWYETLGKKKRFAGIFGGEDDICRHYEDFRKINDRLLVLLGDMGHSFDLRYLKVLNLFVKEVAQCKIP